MYHRYFKQRGQRGRLGSPGGSGVDSTAVSIFVDMLVELTITVFVNSTNIATNIETAVLSIRPASMGQLRRWMGPLLICNIVQVI